MRAQKYSVHILWDIFYKAAQIDGLEYHTGSFDHWLLLTDSGVRRDWYRLNFRYQSVGFPTGRIPVIVFTLVAKVNDKCFVDENVFKSVVPEPVF